MNREDKPVFVGATMLDPTGEFDSAGAIQDLINKSTGEPITLPPGRYRLGKTIVIPGNKSVVIKDCHFIGDINVNPVFIIHATVTLQGTNSISRQNELSAM